MSVHSDVCGRVAVVTIDRPERRNALDPATVDALAEALAAADAAPGVAAVVLTGSGDRAFCAGMDLTGVGEKAPSADRLGRRRYAEFLRCGGAKPVVAAVNGAAVAGGFELMLACDLVVAADHARFALPEVARGLVPGAGGTLLPLRVPRAVAREIALTGAILDAQRALEIGLVNRVVPAAEVVRAAVDLANQVAANSPWAVRRTRDLLAATEELPVSQLWDRINEATAAALAGPDAREGAQAFFERREAKWPSAEA